MASTLARPAEAAADSPAIGLTRRRRIAIWVLIVLASVLGFVTILTTWVDRQMLDNHAWENATTDVIQDPDVRASLSTFLVNQLYDNVDVQQGLEQRLPENLKQLAGPLSTALRQPATNAATAILARPRVQQLWINTTTVAHQKLINVLENKTGYGISTGEGVVTVNLHTLVEQLGTELGLSDAALAKIPADAGVITLMRSDQLNAAQKGVRAVKVLSAWLLAAVVVLFALAVYLARGERRKTLRNVGWAFLIVGVLVLLIRRALGNWAVDTLAAPGYSGTVHDVWLIGTSILGQIGATTVLYGVILIVAAVLAGPTSYGTAVRRWIAPVLNRRPGLTAACVGFAYLLIVLWGPTHALRKWWGILLFGGLLAVGLIALRHQTLTEFPDAETPGLADSLKGRVAAVKGGPTNEGAEPAKPAASAAAEIAHLADLHEAGLISDDEFVRGKELALS